MITTLAGTRTTLFVVVGLAFLSSLLLGAEFDLVSVFAPASRAGKHEGLELHELLAISGIFSVLLAAVAWLNGKVAASDRRARRALEHTAFLDPLTGLSNRRLFNDRLASALAQSRHASQGCAVVLIDLDQFKQVNDTLGHAAGDRLLIEIANRIRSFPAVPQDAARLGGDEFALILRDSAASEGNAHSMIDRLREAIAEPVLFDGQRICPSASVGVAFASESISRGSELLEDADADMYRDKRYRRQRERA